MIRLVVSINIVGLDFADSYDDGIEWSKFWKSMMIFFFFLLFFSGKGISQFKI